eukprot:COSAG06_NODE_47374_length_339_cov_1.341667_1_plen_63_part_00
MLADRVEMGQAEQDLFAAAYVLVVAREREQLDVGRQRRDESGGGGKLRLEDAVGDENSSFLA